jgi:predicted O-methyltransferase YrrM
MKRFARFGLLGFYYLNPAALVVALRRGPRALSRYLKELYRASKLNAGAYLPVIAVEEIVKKPIEFRVFRPEEWHCSMTISEISALCYLVSARMPKKILEIGTYRGLTTLNLALNAPQAEVHTIDITDAWGSYYYSERSEATSIHQHYGDTATFDFAKEIGGSVDFCLIDGGHDYDRVRKDTAKVLPLMSDDGILLWDDYGRNDFLADVESFEVSRFLHEIRSFGTSVLYGTGLGFIQLNREVKQRLIGYLTGEHFSRTATLQKAKVVPRTNG